MAISIGYGTGFILLVALAIIVGYKFYHDHSMGNNPAANPTTQPNAVNPAYNLKY
jgi:hypothetical protein